MNLEFILFHRISSTSAILEYYNILDKLDISKWSTCSAFMHLYSLIVLFLFVSDLCYSRGEWNYAQNTG